jgi:hypothetical protein
MSVSAGVGECECVSRCECECVSRCECDRWRGVSVSASVSVTVSCVGYVSLPRPCGVVERGSYGLMGTEAVLMGQHV